MQSEQLWQNVFTPYRRRILYPITAVGASIFLPLAVLDFQRGRILVGAILVCIVAMLAADALALHRRKAPPIPFAFLMVPAFAGVGMSLATNSVQGAIWSFPVVFLAFFVLPVRAANTISIALMGAGTLFSAIAQDDGTTLRYFLSMMLCLVVINIMLGVLASMHARLIEQSITDGLTGAFNRRHMDANLGEVIERYRRTSAPVTAMMIDIDHFKRINDRHGHEAGDKALTGLVAIVRARSRRLDMLFRQGGEEFLLLLPDTRLAEALIVAENLRKVIARETLVPDERVTVSIGVAELRADDSASTWMKRVDDALYHAKKGGRDRVVGTHLSSLSPRGGPRLRRVAAS